jgi:hypothetical protein
MKPDRRTLLVGAVVIVAAMALSDREGQHPARTGGACCPLIAGLYLPPTNSWAAVESTNAKTGLVIRGAMTNHQG